MRTLIIEDEPVALQRLMELCKEVLPSIEILAGLDSVSEARSWLEKNGDPDLLFTDIQLADGTCFDLFLSYTPRCPVIFTTAYNQYAIEAFRLNTIDYLLKPVKKGRSAKGLRQIR